MQFISIPKTNTEVTTNKFQQQCSEYSFWDECQQAALKIVSGLVDAVQNATINKFELNFSIKNSFQVLSTKAAKHFDISDIYQCRGYDNSTLIFCDTNIGTGISILLPTPKLMEYIMDLIEMRYPEHAEHDVEMLTNLMGKHNLLILLSYDEEVRTDDTDDYILPILHEDALNY